MLVSGVQQSESVISISIYIYLYTYIWPFFFRFFSHIGCYQQGINLQNIQTAQATYFLNLPSRTTELQPSHHQGLLRSPPGTVWEVDPSLLLECEPQSAEVVHATFVFPMALRQAPCMSRPLSVSWLHQVAFGRKQIRRRRRCTL